MIYKVNKLVFNCEGHVVETASFTFPRTFSKDLIKILISEGYSLFEKDDHHKMISFAKSLHDDDVRSYSLYTFLLVNHG